MLDFCIDLSDRSDRGKCLQFRALSDQLYRNPRYYAELRRAAVEYLREHADMYSPYVEGDFEDYCRSMAEDGSWGDHVTLQVRGSELMLSAKVCHASLLRPSQ